MSAHPEKEVVALKSRSVVTYLVVDAVVEIADACLKVDVDTGLEIVVGNRWSCHAE